MIAWLLALATVELLALAVCGVALVLSRGGRAVEDAHAEIGTHELEFDIVAVDRATPRLLLNDAQAEVKRRGPRRPTRSTRDNPFGVGQ